LLRAIGRSGLTIACQFRSSRPVSRQNLPDVLSAFKDFRPCRAVELPKYDRSDLLFVVG
jgi:hypothetical protein